VRHALHPGVRVGLGENADGCRVSGERFARERIDLKETSSHALLRNGVQFTCRGAELDLTLCEEANEVGLCEDSDQKRPIGDRKAAELVLQHDLRGVA